MTDSWEALESECGQCRRCALCEDRHNVVFGCGNRKAKLMFVGEAPGESEDEQGIPFVGRAGKHFDKFLEAVGIERDEVYIANILKCRPPHNRDPKPEEEDLCIGYLRRQTALIRPKMIVCLGRIAAMRIIKPDYRITAEHGQWVTKSGVEITAVYHPSALLRDPRKNEDMLRDMKEIRARLDRYRENGEGEE